MVCLPKSEGGLEVLQLEVHNEALLLKNLHKFFNKSDIPWVHLVWEKYYNNCNLPNHTLKGSFWWTDILSLLGKFKNLASVNINLGDTCFIWHDFWVNLVHSQAYGQLFSFAKSVNISVFRAKSVTDIRTQFHLPISQEAYAAVFSTRNS
jgi:hypothetical protein